MKWDDHALRLSVVDTNENSQSDIVHWTQKFPFPFNHRDYLYVRRYCLDASANFPPKIIIKCHSIDHPDVHSDKKCVRVNKYESSMIIQSKTKLDEVRQTEICASNSFSVCFLERNDVFVNLSRRCQSFHANIDLLIHSAEW